MKIELKNVKHAAFASTDSECFEASIYIDGKRAGTASDDGNGGMIYIQPRELEARLDAYAKTLPPVICEWTNDSGVPDSFEQSAGLVIGELLADWLDLRDMKRAMNGRLLFVSGDGKLLKTGKVSNAKVAAWLANPAAYQPGAVLHGARHVLNNLPEAQALAVYKEFGK